MKIKRIDIIGFKSFVDKVSLDFPAGITVIVGPNGCGKSNIVDAIRWVMGEQSAKNLRGRQMEDIIFGGSESRKPLGMAEVSLVFSTDDGRVPSRYLNYSEIQVTRRLFRDGESEYLLNRTPCRLLDIAELFMDTGVGAKAYSIIEQGKIGMILLSKPEDRRFLIEEAAGVTKFKTRKQVALKKIEITRQNLLRIGDIIAEIKRQLNALQRQAKKAEKFREYREELKEIELQFAARSFVAMEKEKELASAALAQLNDRNAELSSSMQERDLNLEVKRIALLEREKGLASAQEEIFRLKGESRAMENRLEFQRKELLNLERHKARFGEELAVVRSRLADAESELKNFAEERGLFSVELAGEEEKLAREEARLEEMGRGEAELARGLEKQRHDLFALLSEIAQFNNQFSSASKRLESMEERFERNRREEMQLQEQLAETRERSSELEQVLLELRRVREENAVALSSLTAREDGLKKSLSEAEAKLQQRRDELSARTSRLHSLQELEAQFAGYGRGIRTLLLADRFQGRFHGMVADAVETDEEFEAAVEAVLGERLQYVLSSGDDDVMEAIDFLKESSGGRCSFITRNIAVSEPRAPSGAVSLLAKVSIPPDFHPFVQPLLAGVYLADDLCSALTLAGNFPELTFVTTKGEMVQSSGVIHGGSMEGARQGVIHKKREIRDLARESAALAEAVGELEAERGSFREQISSVEEELRDNRQELHRSELDIANAEKDLQRLREGFLRLEERLLLKGLEDEQFRDEKDLLEREKNDSMAKRGAGEERKALLEKGVSDLQGALAEKRRELGEMREMVTAVKVRVAALLEKRESACRAETRCRELIGDLQERLAGSAAELEKGKSESEGIGREIEHNEAALKALMARQVVADEAFAGIRALYEADGAALHEEEGNLRTLRAACEDINKKMAEQGVKLSGLTMKLEHLEDSIAERFRLQVATIVPIYADLPWDEGVKKRRQDELQRFIDEMGEVNLMAIDEYHQLEERFNFLSAQRDDLEESMQALQQAIQRINRTTRKRFLETFQMVNAKFTEIFPRLFCGGSAELRLTDENDLLETGIDIVVQPPGKKLQNVALLSGGEKALTAVALIFSIFLIKPSPFCLLDEVDAPLDDANIGRFNEIVREMSAVSQFIVITHNKTTMGVADTLFGVTMEEPGVSKLVSVKLN
jgi:chromosome segregation protein